MPLSSELTSSAQFHDATATVAPTPSCRPGYPRPRRFVMLCDAIPLVLRQVNVPSSTCLFLLPMCHPKLLWEELGTHPLLRAESLSPSHVYSHLLALVAMFIIVTLRWEGSDD